MAKYDKLSATIALVRAHPGKYEKNFVAVITYLSQYINKQGPTPNVKVASITQSDLPRGRRPVEPMAFSKERESSRSTPGKNMNNDDTETSNL